MKKIYRHFSFFILFIAIILVVSGCGRKSEPVADKPATEKSSEVGEVETATSSSEIAETATSTDEIDTSDWQTYRNEEYGFELRYPKDWTFVGDQLNSFSTPFKEIGVSLECGIFENPNFKSPKEWVDERDFFQLKQFENIDTYIAYGIDDEIETLKINNNIELLNYKGGASGGGVFETAIIPLKGKIIVMTYSLFSPNDKEQMTNVSNLFNQVLKSSNF